MPPHKVGLVIYAGNHRGMPCALGLSGLNQCDMQVWVTLRAVSS